MLQRLVREHNEKERHFISLGNACCEIKGGSAPLRFSSSRKRLQMIRSLQHRVAQLELRCKKIVRALKCAKSAGMIVSLRKSILPVGDLSITVVEA